MAKLIRIRRDAAADAADGEWSREFEELAGMKWPPTTAVAWVEVLTLAGFNQTRVEQTLKRLGFSGFDDAGNLPRGYVSMPGKLWPIFSAMLIAGLRKHRDANTPRTGKPAWDAGRSELALAGRVIRKVRRNASQTRLILDAFEEENWPPRIDNPLRPDADLREAVRTLNRNLAAIRFLRDGTGEGIAWELASR